MALFNFGKKKEEKEITCACNVSTGTQKENYCCEDANISDSIQSIKVLGAGCKSCHVQYENVKEAVKKLGVSIEVEYITDMQKVMEYGVMSMPAIVVNEKVVSMGKVLKVEDVEKILQR